MEECGGGEWLPCIKYPSIFGQSFFGGASYTWKNMVIGKAEKKDKAECSASTDKYGLFKDQGSLSLGWHPAIFSLMDQAQLEETPWGQKLPVPLLSCQLHFSIKLLQQSLCYTVCRNKSLHSSSLSQIKASSYTVLTIATHQYMLGWWCFQEMSSGANHFWITAILSTILLPISPSSSILSFLADIWNNLWAIPSFQCSYIQSLLSSGSRCCFYYDCFSK